MVNGATSVDCKKRTSADEIVCKAEVLAVRAEQLSKIMAEKLSRVVLYPPMEGEGEESHNSRVYPPLFSELDALLGRIDAALDSITTTIDCTQL